MSKIDTKKTRAWNQSYGNFAYKKLDKNADLTLSYFCRRLVLNALTLKDIQYNIKEHQESVKKFKKLVGNQIAKSTTFVTEGKDLFLYAYIHTCDIAYCDFCDANCLAEQSGKDFLAILTKYTEENIQEIRKTSFENNKHMLDEVPKESICALWTAFNDAFGKDLPVKNKQGCPAAKREKVIAMAGEILECPYTKELIKQNKKYL